MKALKKYFVQRTMVGEPGIIHFMSSWATSFCFEKHKSTKNTRKICAIDALTDLRRKIDAAIKEIENE